MSEEYKPLKPGWLKRQIDAAVRDLEAMPEWWKRLHLKDDAQPPAAKD